MTFALVTLASDEDGTLRLAVPRLAEEGIVGADAIFACLGPALEIFARYSRVERADGTTVALRQYLEEVWAAVSKEALNRKVGARGLRMILEELMLELMYHLPSQKKVKDFEVTKEMVEKRDISLASLEKQAS